MVDDDLRGDAHIGSAEQLQFAQKFTLSIAAERRRDPETQRNHRRERERHIKRECRRKRQAIVIEKRHGGVFQCGPQRWLSHERSPFSLTQAQVIPSTWLTSSKHGGCSLQDSRVQAPCKLLNRRQSISLRNCWAPDVPTHGTGRALKRSKNPLEAVLQHYQDTHHAMHFMPTSIEQPSRVFARGRSRQQSKDNRHRFFVRRLPRDQCDQSEVCDEAHAS